MNEFKKGKNAATTRLPDTNSINGTINVAQHL